MKGLLRGAAALVTLAALMTAPAMAQKGLSNHFMLKGGIYTPTKGVTKQVGRNWWTAGAEYEFQNPNATAIDAIEFLYSAKDDTIHQFGVQDIPTRYRQETLMWNRKYRVLKQGLTPGNLFFYGGGIGLDFVRVKVEDPNPGGEGSFDQRKTVGAANLFAGYEFAQNFQVEAKYLFTGKAAGRKFDGWMLLAGVKF